MFVKWSCGCKGLIVDGNNWVIDSCDRSYEDCYGEISLYERNMTDCRSSTLGSEERKNFTEEQLREYVPKPHKPLPYDEVRKYLVEMSRLIMDGYAFRQMQSLLSRKWEPYEEPPEEDGG